MADSSEGSELAESILDDETQAPDDTGALQSDAENALERASSSDDNVQIEEFTAQDETCINIAPESACVTPQRHVRRPSSARVSLKRKEETQTTDDPNTWNIHEVLCWIDSKGFYQYRKRFLHNAIDGKLLLKLTDQELKCDLGIGPLGHRRSILDAIHELKQGSGTSILGSSCSRKNRPRSAPARTKLQIVETCSTDLQRQRVKLENAINRTQAEITRNKSRLQQLTENIEHDEERLKNLFRSLTILDSNSNPMSLHEKLALDKQGKVPWFPVGEMTCTRKLHPERYGTHRDLAHVDEIFQPRINSSSILLLENSKLHRKTFLDRLHDDLTSRAIKQQEMEQKTGKASGKELSPAELERDVEIVRQFLTQLNIEELPETVEDLLTVLNEEVDLDQVQDQLELTESELHRLERTKGTRKISLLAGAIKTHHFMESYKLELETRDSKLKDLQKKWLQETLQIPDNTEQTKKEITGLKEYVVKLGWNEDNISDEHIDALIRRVQYLKESKEKNQEPNWSNFKDGLEQMQKTAKSADGAEVDDGEITLDSTVQLLSGLSQSDLQKILTATGDRKQVILYRFLRSQKFLNFVSKDIDKREEKRRSYWQSSIPEKKVLSKEQVEGFFDRLIEDGIKRRERQEQRINEKQMKEDQLIKEMANRIHFRKPRPPSSKHRRKR